MAGLPPGMSPPQPPPGGPPGGPPPGAAPAFMPPGAPPMPGPMPFAPQMGPPQGPPDYFLDVSDDLPKHFQILDAAMNMCDNALTTGDFYQSPEIRAHVAAHVKEIKKIIADEAKSKQERDVSPPVNQRDTATSGDTTSMPSSSEE